MDSEETKNCPNCKREIPAVNFTIHSVHCARNIKLCPVCKEPVPAADLPHHHDTHHKLRPCKKCGESVCGTDLEDHIRDSCARTIQSCRYCELELARCEVPAHEAYCGVRTERCARCGEWVMARYRQLHLDSNHGFIRLDDDPVPDQKIPWKSGPTRPQRPPSTASGGSTSIFDEPVLRLRPADGLSDSSSPNSTAPAGRFDLDPISPRVDSTPRSGSSGLNGAVKTDNVKRSIERADESRASGDGLHPAGGARPRGVKKRTNDQPQINTDTSATKNLDKDIRSGVKKRSAPPPPSAARDLPYYSALQRHQREERERAQQNQYNLAHGLPPVLNPAQKLERLRRLDALQRGELAAEARPLRDLKPMSPEQFLSRVSALRLAPDPPDSCDRFRQIKSSLTELRRGLNQVTAPYNARRSPSPPPRAAGSVAGSAAGSAAGSGDTEERLPCEFCERLVAPDELVLHQTGCRPELAQLRVAEGPLIPCEFCLEPLPVYLVAPHQRSCAHRPPTPD